MSTQDYQDWIRRVLIPLSFRSMSDTPGTYVSAAKKSVVVNDSETALEFSNVLLEDHSVRHESGGADEISVAGLSGELADKQKSKGRFMVASGGQDAINEVSTGEVSYITAYKLLLYINSGDDSIFYGACVRAASSEIPAETRVYNSTAGGSKDLSVSSSAYSWNYEVKLGISGLSEGWHIFEIQLKTTTDGYLAHINGYSLAVEK